MFKQVNLFLSEGCPSKVGLEAQVRPQARTSVSCLEKVYSLNRYSRFEGGCSMDPLKEKPSNVAQIKWKCPPKVSNHQEISGLPLLELTGHAAKDTTPSVHNAGLSSLQDVPNCLRF